LFDEPLSNLDAKLRVQMRLEIRELQAKLGITALYVTHDQVEAMTMADRMIVMNAGIAEQIGTPLEVYSRPLSLFAAQFIGSPSMNVIEGVADSKEIKLVNGATLVNHTKHQGNVSVGIRPEHVALDENGPLEFDVTLTEPLGANTLVHGKLKNSDMLFTISLPGVYQHASKDKPIRFGVLTENIHLFDTGTGKRIGS
jgi:sn-glycerol 3-phosphate transport system ATP-binding protein